MSRNKETYQKLHRNLRQLSIFSLHEIHDWTDVRSCKILLPPPALSFEQFSSWEKDTEKVFPPETFDDKRTDNPPIEKKNREFIGLVSEDVKIQDLKRRPLDFGQFALQSVQVVPNQET